MVIVVVANCLCTTAKPDVAFLSSLDISARQRAAAVQATRSWPCVELETLAFLISQLCISGEVTRSLHIFSEAVTKGEVCSVREDDGA